MQTYLHRAREPWTITQLISDALPLNDRYAKLLTFLNNARAKHNNCRCPADNDDPPSRTGASSPSGRFSTYDLR